MMITALLLAVQAQTQLPNAVRTAAEQINAASVARDFNYLSSDALMGRNTPSPGFDSAAAYIARRLERAGLRAMGDDGTWFQRYTIRELVADTASAYIEAGGRRFRYGTDFYYRAFPRSLNVTAEAVNVGHGWIVPDHNVDAYAETDVRGRIVIATGRRGFPEGVSVTQIGRMFGTATTPWEAAHRRGAAAVIIAAPADSSAPGERFPRSLGGLEMEPSVPSAYAAIPIVTIVARPNLIAAMARGRVTLSLPAVTNVTHEAYNVVAMIPGSDPALREEYITIMSHLDGAVGSRAIGGDSIYNSADDNASGSAGNLHIAEQIARGPKPKRSLIFIWDSGEERGLWGTRFFVANPPVPLDRIVAHVNIDMIGADRRPGSPDSAESRVTESDEIFLIGPGVLSRDADQLLESTNRQYNTLRFNRAYDRADHEFFYPRTDAGPFLERGIITIGYTTGIHPRYHRPADEVAALSVDKIVKISRSILAQVWMLADMPQRPRLDAMPAGVPQFNRMSP